MYANQIKMVYISSDDIIAGLPLFFIICGVIMLICFFIVRSVEVRNNRLPVQDVNAKIIDLRQESTYGIITLTWILFEISDGNRVRLATDMKHEFMVGDKGVLKYQGERFISFEHENTKETRNNMEGNELLEREIEVSQAEIRYLMQKKNIPYGEAVLLARKIKKKKLEKGQDQ